MAFTTLISKYPGTCRRCGLAFEKGTRIRYGGRSGSYHLAAECPANTQNAIGQTPRETADPGLAVMTNYADEMHDRGFLYGERE